MFDKLKTSSIDLLLMDIFLPDMKETADALFLGVRSVEKIRAKSTVGLLKYAIKKRIIGPGVQKTDFIK